MDCLAHGYDHPSHTPDPQEAFGRPSGSLSGGPCVKPPADFGKTCPDSAKIGRCYDTPGAPPPTSQGARTEAPRTPLTPRRPSGGSREASREAPVS